MPVKSLPPEGAGSMGLPVLMIVKGLRLRREFLGFKRDAPSIAQIVDYLKRNNHTCSHTIKVI
jgi:hypothetical protein